MSEYDNNNRGALWTNERKRPSSRDPQWTGSAMVDGVEYWVSAWPGDKDKPRAPKLSFSFTRKDKVDKVNETVADDSDLDADIPF